MKDETAKYRISTYIQPTYTPWSPNEAECFLYDNSERRVLFAGTQAECEKEMMLRIAKEVKDGI